MAVELAAPVSPPASRGGRHPVATLITRRTLLGVLTLWLVSVLVFAVTLLLPGDAAKAILGRYATPVRVRALTDQLHLNQPVFLQYWHWLLNAVQGKFGSSFAAGEPVLQLLGHRMENSGFLVLVSAVVAIPASFVLAAWSAIRRDRLADHVIGAVTLFFASLPEFIVGIGLAIVFATTVVHVLPPDSLIPPTSAAWDHMSLVVLPAATLVLVTVPYIVRIARASIIEALESEYVEMARLRGLGWWRVLVVHAMRNSLVPAIQVSAIELAWMAGGVVLVESVYSYPGIGTALVDAVGNRDIPVIQAITLAVAAVYVLVNLAADVATILLTPRLRTAAG